MAGAIVNTKGTKLKKIKKIIEKKNMTFKK